MRRTLLGVTSVLMLLPLLGAGSGSEPGRVIRVPLDAPTLQAAVDAARPGDLVLVEEGTYPGGVTVSPNTHDITIRGVDRNAVVLHGQDQQANAIEILGDRVTVENMTAHDFTANGFYWENVDGFAGRYLTVWNVQVYGIYAVGSRSGTFDHDYVSWAGDAAYYIGECHPCDTDLHDLVATDSAVGYSGTNAGGNLILHDSLLERDGTGIFPNSYDTGEAPPPQQDAIFRHNVVQDSGRVRTPMTTPLGGFAGIGIAIAGGSSDVVDRNTVTGSARYGIAIYPTVQEDATRWTPIGNRVTGNHVEGSGLADLALAAGSGPGNCFEANRSSSTDPASIADTPCGSAGSAAVAGELVLSPSAALAAHPERSDGPPYTAGAAPPRQPAMPGDVGRFLAAGPAVSVFVGWALMGIGTALLVVAVWRRKPVNGAGEERRSRADRPLATRGRTSMVAAIAALVAVVAGAATLFAAGGSDRTIHPSIGGSPPGSPTGTPEADGSAPSLAEVTGTLVFARLEGSPADIAAGRGVAVVYTSAIDGSGSRQIARVPQRSVEHLRWSPDGSKIAFVAIDQNLHTDVRTMNADGTSSRVITKRKQLGDCDSPAWSPDGSKMAFDCTLDQNGRPGSIYIADPDGSSAARLTQGQSPAWSPDGRRIAFQRLVHTSPTEGHWDLFVVAVSGGTVARLTDTAAEEQHPAWSPDGTRIAFDAFVFPVTPPPPGTPHPPTHIYVVPADGSATPIRVTPDTSAVESDPRWISGDLIAFSTYGSDAGEGVGIVLDGGSAVAVLRGRFLGFDIHR